MKKSSEEFKKIIKEIAIREAQYLIEGIDIDYKNRTVGFNPTHENNVDTSVILNPKYSNINGIDVISLFTRKKSISGGDGNPLIYALKGLNDWKFKNGNSDIYGLLRQFLLISQKIKEKYDTIITIPSSKYLNTIFLHKLNKIIKADNLIEDYFYKMLADEVFEDYVDWQSIDRDNSDIEFEKISKDINMYFYNMHTKNNGIFSYKYIKNPDLRKYIKKTMWSTEEKSVECAPYINGKSILILDDTISSGQSISEATSNIANIFDPKSITVITLFSAL